MATTKGPLFSTEAKGKLGNSMIFSSWKGRSYVRGLTKQADPNSVLQIGVRSAFAFLSSQWSTLTSPQQTTWLTPAKRDGATPFHSYMAEGLAKNRENLPPSKVWPYAPTGFVSAISTLTATPGTRQITIHAETTAFGIQNWGIQLHRSLTTPFTPSIENQIAIVHLLSNSEADYVDTPLNPDTYYYNARPFNLTGEDSVYFGEINATI